jgi:5-methylcytosine-specific restriction endonuclease McrA
MADAHSSTTHKRCSKCRETKTTDNFGFQKRRKDGRNPWCRACKSIDSAAWHAKNTDRVAEQKKIWRANNPDKVKAIKDRYAERHPEAAKAAFDKYRAKNKDKARAWSLANYERHRPARLASMKAYREANKERVRDISMKWRAANKGRLAILKRAYKARKRSAEGKFTPQDIDRLRSLQRDRCACCRDKLRDFHIDHRTPLSLGGSNDPSNLQLLCPPCNLKKHAKDPIDYMQSLGFLL